MNVRSAALAWHDAGYAVLPVRTDGSKAPNVAWRQFIHTRPTRQQIVDWFPDDHPGLGLICGEISGGLEMLELEGRAIEAGKLAELQELATAADLGEVMSRLLSGYCERTPSGGLHLLYRVNDGSVPGNTKLAMDADGLVLAETRGEGGFVVVAPSNGTSHPTGRPWVALVGDVVTVPTLTCAERAALHTVVRCLDETPPPEDKATWPGEPIAAEGDAGQRTTLVDSGSDLQPSPIGTPGVDIVAGWTSSSGATVHPSGGPRPGSSSTLAPGDDFEDRSTWEEILTPHGWRLMFRRGAVTYWRRPGKRLGISATTGHAGDRDRLYVFSSSTPFRVETPYTRFAAYAVLEHGGDYSAAAGELHARGYGQRAQAPDLTPLARPLSATDSAEQQPAVLSDLDVLRGHMRARLYDRDGLDAIPAPSPLVADVLDVATVAVLAGKFGTYKTFISVAWACSIATGTPWFGHGVERPGPVLYVAGEGGNGLKQRIRAWEMDHLDGARVPASRLMVYDGRIKLNSAQEVRVLAEFVGEIAPVLTIIDTLHKCAPGVDEDNAKEMSLILDVAAGLRELFSTTILFNHHTGHSGMRSRGTSSIEDDADTCWVVKLDGDGEDRSAANPRILTHRKSKNSVLCDDIPLGLSLVDGTGSACIAEAPDQVLAGGLVVPALAAQLDVNDVPRGLSVRKTREAGGLLGFKQSVTVWMAVANLRRTPLADEPEGSE